MGSKVATQRLADLREPPIVGQYYLVPAVEEYPYFKRVDTWPVIGPKHEDGDVLSFPWHHYHVDARFLTANQERFILSKVWQDVSVEGVVGRSPLYHTGEPLPNGRPALVRRKCRRATYGYAYAHMSQIQKLRDQFGEVVEPIRLDDGRVLCPHRKADLTQFPADADGIVTCPLHGLRLCVAKHDRIEA